MNFDPQYIQTVTYGIIDFISHEANRILIASKCRQLNSHSILFHIAHVITESVKGKEYNTTIINAYFYAINFIFM